MIMISSILAKDKMPDYLNTLKKQEEVLMKKKKIKKF